MFRSLRAFRLLFLRNVEAFLADRINAFWAFVQVPLIAGLILIAFSDFDRDEAPLDYFVRFSHASELHLKEQMEKYDRLDKIIRSETPELIHVEAKRSSEMISAATGQRRASIYFLLVSSAIWFGIMGACKEVVYEQHVLYREFRSCFGVSSFLLAKFIFQAVIVGIQTGLLSFLVSFHLLEADMASWRLLWGLLWVSALASVSLGLLLSSISANIRVALTLVPLLMIPQFLMGGLLRAQPSAINLTDPPGLEGMAPVETEPTALRLAREFLTALVIQRWGFEAAVAVDPAYGKAGVLSLAFSWGEETINDADALKDLLLTVRTSDRSLVDTLFLPMQAEEQVQTRAILKRALPPVLQESRYSFPLTVLILMSIGCLVSSYFVIKIRFS